MFLPDRFRRHSLYHFDFELPHYLENSPDISQHSCTFQFGFGLLCYQMQRLLEKCRLHCFCHPGLVMLCCVRPVAKYRHSYHSCHLASDWRHFPCQTARLQQYPHRHSDRHTETPFRPSGIWASNQTIVPLGGTGRANALRA